MADNFTEVVPVKSEKYLNQSSIAKKLISGFFNAARDVFESLKNESVDSILEIGAGEGHVSELLAEVFKKSNLVLTDIYNERLKLCEERVTPIKGDVIYRFEDICGITCDDESQDLVVCCEVLEHIEYYKDALKEIKRIIKKDKYLVISVPREPMWRILNIARGKYISDLGNTPTHVNHWSSSSLQKLLKKNHFEVQIVKKPIPWTFVLAKKL